MWREILKALKVFEEQYGFGGDSVADAGEYFVYHSPSYGRNLRIPDVTSVITDSIAVMFRRPVDVDTGWFNGKFAVYAVKRLAKADDIRHSPRLDDEDTTECCDCSGGTECFRVDYGDVKTMHIVVVLGYRSTKDNYHGYVYLEASSDGESWERLYRDYYGVSSEKIVILLFKNISLRYLRVVADNKGSTSFCMCARLRKVVAVEV